MILVLCGLHDGLIVATIRETLGLGSTALSRLVPRSKPPDREGLVTMTALLPKARTAITRTEAVKASGDRELDTLFPGLGAFDPPSRAPRRTCGMARLGEFEQCRFTLERRHESVERQISALWLEFEEEAGIVAGTP